ncbi:glycosyltransferase [Akkermansiaceae bacterium]|nr:glycosyltransferase [Akkermansiaceae bacterium]
MKISIITVSYNSAETIEATFISVLQQTYSDIEYIVIDGGSTDHTLKIAKKYKDLINVIVSEPDKGLYDAMNKGIKLASGDVIGFINSDDLFCDREAIEKVMNLFKMDDKLDSVYADLAYVSRHNTNKIRRNWVSGARKKFKTGWHPAHPTFYVKKIIYDKYGLFDMDYKLAADFEIMLRFLDRQKITSVYVEAQLVKMRLGGETNKSFKNIVSQNRECLKAFEKNGLKISKVFYLFSRIVPKLVQFRR